jgi:hypothetical protein
MQKNEETKSGRKCETKNLWAKQTGLLKPALQPFCSFSHMGACRSSLENTWKMSLILVCDSKSPRAHTESKLGLLGVHKKLVKYVVQLSKRKI